MKDNIFITGGTGKIGGQLVAHFIKLGWSVTTSTRRKNNIFKLEERGLLSKNQCTAVKVIEVDFEQKNAIEKIDDFFKKNPNNYPKALINNARSLDTLQIEIDGSTARTMLEREYLINVIVPYELSMLFANLSPTLKSIINISSIYGVVPFNANLYLDYPHSSPIQYSLSKAALIHLTKELAIRFSDKKISVNTVSYGGVAGRVDAQFKQRYASLCPDKEMLTEEQVIGPIDFLVSDGALGINGHNLIQDGGWTIW